MSTRKSASAAGAARLSGASGKAQIGAAKEHVRDVLDEVGRLLSEIHGRHCTPTDERMALLVQNAIDRLKPAGVVLLSAVRARLAELDAYREAP